MFEREVLRMLHYVSYFVRSRHGRGYNYSFICTDGTFYFHMIYFPIDSRKFARPETGGKVCDFSTKYQNNAQHIWGDLG